MGSEINMRITNLGTLGGNYSQAVALNERGHVLGSSKVPGDSDNPFEQHSFLWKDGTLQDLGRVFGMALNNLDQVVGTLMPKTINPFEPDFVFAMRPFFWEDDQCQDLLPQGTAFGSATAINDLGQVGGQAVTLATDYETQNVSQGFLWQAGQFSYLPIPPKYDSGEPKAVNNRGQIVGKLEPTTTTPPSFSRFAAFWEGKNVTVLNLPPGFYKTCAVAINAPGQILVEAFVVLSDVPSTEQNTHEPVLRKRAGFLWDMGQATPLLAGDNGVYPRGLNDHGQVVGELWLPDKSRCAFLWQNGEMRDLNTAIPADSGWDLTKAVDINNQGQIVGTGKHNGVSYAYLLTPD